MMESPEQNRVDVRGIEHKKYLLSFQGQGGTLFGIQIVNLLLTIVTLGIYYFWAKTKVRAYIWGQTDFDGDRFGYTGTGKEVLLGWIKAMLIFGLPLYLLKNLPILLGAPKYLIVLGSLASLMLIMLFIPVATVGSRRYRLSRTSLRGIRFSFRGRWFEYARVFVPCAFLLIITLGLYMPYFEMRSQKFLLGKSFFGNRNFSFDGEGCDLLGLYVAATLLALPTLFLSLLWYQCKKTNYVWSHVSFGDARFTSTLTFGGLFKLYFVNILIVVFSLGFGAPWARVRKLRYFTSNLSLEGRLDLDNIVQEAQQSTAVGEEIGDFLAMDFDLA